MAKDFDTIDESYERQIEKLYEWLGLKPGESFDNIEVDEEDDDE